MGRQECHRLLLVIETVEVIVLSHYLDTPARDHTTRLAASINNYGTKLVAAAQIKANSKLNAVGAQIINDLRGQKRDLVHQIAVETIKKKQYYGGCAYRANGRD